MWNEFAEWAELRNARFAHAVWPSVEPEAYEVLDADAKRALAMPRQELSDCTWVLGDAEAERRFCGPVDGGWQAQVRQQLRAARYGLSFSAAQISAAQELARGEVRPLFMGGPAELEAEEQESSISPLNALAQEEQGEWLLLQMSARQREAVELKAEGMSRRQMAEAMGCSEERVKELLKDARKRARALVEAV